MSANPPPLLKVVVLNTENLFVAMDKWQGEPVESMDERQWQTLWAGLLPNKPLGRLLDLAHTLKQLDPDIVMMTEVGGPASIDNFNRHFLAGRYRTYLEEGNSDRGIDMGFLLRGDWDALLTTHRDRQLSHAKFARFSRDVLRLELSRHGTTWFNLLLVHLKSKLNMRGEDFEGRTRRAVETRELSQLVTELPTDIPLMLGGDFNGLAHLPDPEPEFLSLYHLANLKDAVELSSLPPEERFSYIHFRSDRRILQQLDYLFLNEPAQKLLDPASVQFPRYTGRDGTLLPIPVKFEQKRLLPSDHFPLYAEFDLVHHPLWKG